MVHTCCYSHSQNEQNNYLLLSKSAIVSHHSGNNDLGKAKLILYDILWPLIVQIVPGNNFFIFQNNPNHDLGPLYYLLLFLNISFMYFHQGVWFANPDVFCMTF